MRVPRFLPTSSWKCSARATVVPRDNMPTTPLDPISKMPSYVPLSILDSRVAVPKDAHVSQNRAEAACRHSGFARRPRSGRADHRRSQSDGPAGRGTHLGLEHGRAIRFHRLSLRGDPADSAWAESVSRSGNRPRRKSPGTTSRISICRTISRTFRKFLRRRSPKVR